MQARLATSLTHAPSVLARRIIAARDQRLAAGAATALLASYPKSGRTWVRFMLAQYFVASRANERVTTRTMFSLTPNFDLNPSRGIPAFIRRTEATAIPMVPSTHAAFGSGIPRYLPVIFLIRDPRAVLNSAFHHVTRHKHSFSGSMDDFLSDGRKGLPHYVGYMNSWNKRLSTQSSMVIHYEDLISDPGSEIIKVLEFLQEPVDLQALDLAVHNSSFERMRALEIEEGLLGHAYDRSDENALRMRKGRVDGYREELTDAQQNLVEQACQAHLHEEVKARLQRYGFLAEPNRATVSAGAGGKSMKRGALGHRFASSHSMLGTVLQVLCELMIVVGLAAMFIAPLILAIEVGEWLLRREWDGYSVEDGLGLFGIDRPGPVETPNERMLDVLLAFPLTFALFLAGLLMLLVGVRYGDWGIQGVRLKKKLTVRRRRGRPRRSPDEPDLGPEPRNQRP